MTDDSWRKHSSFQNISEEGGRDVKRGGGGPQFTRVVPKFLQKYHTPTTLDHEASLALKQPQENAEDNDEEELDEVQQEALRAYEEAETKKADAADKKEGREADSDDEKTRRPEKRKAMTFSTSKKEMPSAAVKVTSGVDETTANKPKKKRKVLDNKKLLSFSMDDD
ncbi:Aste57867_15452 [Aphanomyces stellatus]|uniref:Aste57867_15452 protein n=1 Tax=Aphanomyces stellatus TaxID=120398 RepID=A0A485L630_9STRA|nr:hypothetical protein As57867_015396 [Aphanomyces stellatus]VFT92254.1 Aste57867_15452 [Aphanomyces stellatus]